jgi:type IV pilus assembly protein PilV
MKKNLSQRGMALIESMVAIVILSVGVLGTIGLQAKALSSLSDSRSRVEATMAAEKLIGTIWNDQVNAASYATGGSGLNNWKSELADKVPGATGTVTITATTPVAGTTRNQVDIVISWQRRAGDDVSTHRVTAFLEPAR